MKVIALSGWKKSGKDTAGSYLYSSYGAQRIALADPLKDLVSSKYGIPRNWLDEQRYKESPITSLPVIIGSQTESMYDQFRLKDGSVPEYSDFQYMKTYWTPRALAIHEGTSARAVDKDFWTKKAIQSINNNLTVVTDVRFKNEIALLRNCFKDDFVTIRINRFEESDSSDPSETELNGHKFDYTINNKDSLINLYNELDRIMYEIGFSKHESEENFVDDCFNESRFYNEKD